MKRPLVLAAVLFAFAWATGANANDPPKPSAEAKAQLAPSGKLRLGYTVNNPNYVTQPAGEKLSGVGPDLGEALAKQLGVPLEVVRYTETAAVVGDATKGKWDVALLADEASRRETMAFSAPYALSKNSYIVPAGSAIKTVQDVDRKGVKVAVANKTAQHTHLAASLKNASLMPQATSQASEGELKAGRVDAVAANLSTLEGMMARTPGFRVIPGSFLDIQYALAVPKGKDAGAAYLSEFVKHSRSSGAMQKSLEQAKLKGVSVP